MKSFKSLQRLEFDPKIGIEVEFHLINQQGDLVNFADLILSDEETSDFIVPELSESMIEVLSEPANNLSDLAKSLISNIVAAKKIAQKHNLKLLASTPISYTPIKKRISARYKKKNVILGDKKRELELNICGTHVHVDKYEKDLMKQHTVMTALDPLFAFMSSSSFLYGKNTLNNYRNKIYRQDVFSEFPEFGRLLPYAKKNENLYVRYERLYDKWAKICCKYGFDTEGFTKLNTCWGPIRFSQRTIESRASDTNLTSNVLALAAIYFGVNRQMKKIQKINGQYFLDNTKLLSYRQLKIYEKKIILEGLKNKKVKKYLESIISFAKKGLREDEKKYLKPFEQMLDEDKNFADQITDFAKTTGYYELGEITNQGANMVRNYIVKRFEGDLDECSILS